MKQVHARLMSALAAAALLAAACEGSRGPAGDTLRFAFVTNNSANFWNIAQKGIDKAVAETGVEVEMRRPLSGQVAEQQQIIENLIVKGVDGMAISPIDPANMTDILNRAAESMHLLTHDSDAPDSHRLAYVGTNNYEAGREAGAAMMDVLPGGGDVVVFVGSLDAVNARERLRGFTETVAGSGINILEVRLDNTDPAKAQENVESAIVAHPAIAGFLGLWSYNGPAIAAAVKSAGKQGEIQIVCFDEEDATLAAIQEAVIHATVVQKPFEFGYRTITILAALAAGDRSAIPSDGIIDTGVEVIRRDNVDAFWARLKALQR